MFGDGNGLADIFLDRRTAAEPAAEHGPMHRDFLVRHVGRDRGGGERGRRILGRHPDLDAIGAHMGGAGLRLHGGMGEKRHFVIGLDPHRRPCQGRSGVAVGAANLHLGVGVEPRAHECGD